MREWTLREWKSGKSFKPEAVTKGYYYSKISRIATSQFQYDVEDVDSDLIEKWLWTEGLAMVWKSPIFGWTVLPCTETAWGADGQAVKWKPRYVYSNGLEEPPELGIDDDMVVFYDTTLRIPSNACVKWIDEIADINETIKTQIFNQKTPLIAVSKNPREKDKLKNAIVEIASNVKALVLDSEINQDIKALSIDAPFNIQELQAYLKTKESEMLEFLGVDSQSGFQKKERLITDEQESNNQILSYLLMDRLRAREIACEKLRKKGLDIRVGLSKTFNPNGEVNVTKDSQDSGMESD